MQNFRSKFNRFPGSEYREVYRQAMNFYKQIVSKSKRTPYVRSAYFDKSKIFLDSFWIHLRPKRWPDRMRRLKHFASGIDLICNSKTKPVTRIVSDLNHTIVYRFVGLTKDNYEFFVQVKHDLKTNRLWLISIFPQKK